MRHKIFPFIIALSALAVSGSAAYYSITGLAKLFAGASTQVAIMAASLEAAKLVMASLLYQYWDKLNKLLRTYLAIALVVLIGITSAGIYGYLSSAYQDTANKAAVVEKETQVYVIKKQRFEQTRNDQLAENQQLDDDISQLRNALATGSVTQSIDSKTGQLVTKANSANRAAFEKQLNTAITSKETLSLKIQATADSITALDMKILDIESKAELSAELGPLKYLSNLTGKPMDQIINWFLLIIIFVFDPLAIALVISANFAFQKIQSSTPEEVLPPLPIEPVSAEEINSQPPTPPKKKPMRWINNILTRFDQEDQQ